MSLGYALLHPNRIQSALEGDSRKRSFDDLTDFAFATMGAGDLGSAATAFAQSRTEQVSDWFAASRSQWLGSNGPFGFLEPLLEQFSTFETIPDLLEDLFNLLESLTGPTLRESLHRWVDQFCSALPNLNGAAVQSILQEQVEAIAGILEQPLRSGRRDVAAHRAFRAAVTMRQFIGDTLREAPWANSQFDLKMPLCLMLHQIVAEVSDEILSAVASATETFRETFGSLFNAGFSFGGSAGGAAGSDSPQPMANGSPSFRDDVKAVPHDQPGGIWAIDLVTNIFATFSLIWESVRTGNYKGRGFDGFLSVITILWQVTHTVMRAIPETPINRAIEESSEGKKFLNWLFTDQGNFSLNIVIRLCQSFHEGSAASNWALSIARRLLSYYTYVTNIRSIYYYSRSAWYFQNRAENRTPDEPEQVSFGRLLWGHWGPMSWFAAFFSFFLAWKDFSLETGFTARTIALLSVGIGGGLILGYLSLGLIAQENPFGLSISADWPTIILFYVLWILALIAMIMILADLESDSKGIAIGAFVGVAVIVLIPMLGLPIVFGENNGAEATFVTWFVISGGLFAAGIIPSFLWWYYIDDGRDKHALFEDKNVDTSPYLLPYPAEENWLCGQGNHGIFSHYPVDLSIANNPDNHYAYDFNESENKNTLTARSGIVIDIVKDNSNGSDDANSILVQNLGWVEGHDPGTDQERILTYSIYYHLSQNHIYADTGHHFDQGYHIADIDNTGVSAQHHLHFSVGEYQRRAWQTNWRSDEPVEINIPTIFKDASTQRFRNFPLLAWIPGKGHIPGKPLSMAFYTSENQERPPLVNPVVISLAEDTATNHEHWIILDRKTLGLDPIPASITLRTTVNERHFHEINLTRSQLEQMLRMEELTGLTVSPVRGHDHNLIGFKYLQPMVLVRFSSEADPSITAPNIDPGHRHWVWIDQQTLGWAWGALPNSHTFTSGGSNNSASAAHTHDLTLNKSQLVDLLRRRRLPGGLLSSNSGGHQHSPQQVDRQTRQPKLMLITPPAAGLLATQPGPYQMVGDQLVVRVNERATEYFFYGAIRPRLSAELTLDRGLGASASIEIDGTPYRLTSFHSDFTVQGTVAALNAEFESALPRLHVALRPEPVIVIETLRQGSAATLQVGAGASPAFEVSPAATGSGALGSLTGATPAELAAHFDSMLRNGWPTPPGPIRSQVVAGNRLEITVGGNAITLPATPNTRNGEIFSKLYDAANRRLRSTGRIPFSRGRIPINGFGLPIVATCAQVRIDTNHSAFTGADLTSNPLQVTLQGHQFNIPLATGEATPAILARKISLAVEGVQTWVSGAAEVTVQTVAAGTAIQLTVAKAMASGAALNLQSIGSTLNLNVLEAGCTFNGRIDDTCALEPEHLCALLSDGVGRATLPYNAATVAPQARMEGNVLVLEVASGGISLVAETFSGGQTPFQFTQNGANQLRSSPLSSSVNLAGPGWVELEIDGHRVIVPFDGAPARLELRLGDRLPSSGDSLNLTINGAAATALNFTGSEDSVAAVATAIAQQFADVSVRLGYRLTFENTRYKAPSHALTLTDASGLALAGFLADRSTYTTTAAIAQTTDHLDLPAALTSPVRDSGVPAASLTFTETTSGSDVTWVWTAPAGFTFAVNATPAVDVLTLSVGTPPTTLTTGPIPPELALRHSCQHYVVKLQNSGGQTVIQSRVQIAAAPAILRATDGLDTTALPDDTLLPITVIEPAGAGTTTQTFSLDLADVGSLDEVAHQLNAQVPALRAWVAHPGGAGGQLHLETRGQGNGWRLRLENPPLLLALGFGAAQIDLVAGHLEASGGGDIRNGQRATQAEIRAAMERLVASATLLGVTAPAGPPQTLQVARSGAGLVLRSPVGPITLETSPPSLKAALQVTESGNEATILPTTPTVSLDSGTIVVKVEERTVAAVHIYGDAASLIADDPLPTIGSADETRQLNQLKAHRLTVEVNGSRRTLGRLPSSISTLRDAVAWYGDRLPNTAWISLDSGNHMVLRTRQRGKSRALSLDFNAFSGESFPPGATLLGFPMPPASFGWTYSAQGTGNVDQLEAIPIQCTTGTCLESLLTTAAQNGAARQAVYDAEVDSATTPPTLRLRATTAVPPQEMRHPLTPGNPAPGSLRLNPPGGGGWGPILEGSYALITPVRPGEVNLQIRSIRGASRRNILALIAGAPARLPALIFPSSLAVLNGKGVNLTVTTAAGTSTLLVQFTGISNQREVSRQIELQSQGKVQANVVANTLVLETLDTGSAITLALSAPTSISNAVTNDQATGLVAGSTTAPQPLPLTARGDGTVPDISNITANQYREALLAGFIAQSSLSDQAVRSSRRLNWQAYEIRPGSPGNFFTLTSDRDGCLSAVEPIANFAPGLALNISMARGPAVRGSVVLPLPALGTLAADRFTLANAAVLTIELNHNTKGTSSQIIEDLPNRTLVDVAFPAGDYTAQDIARRIHAELASRNAGQAAAYPDGQVVVETAVPGLAGSVTIPAPGTGTAGNDLALVQQLLGTTASVSGRGWPGVGFDHPGQPLRAGYRSQQLATAQATAVWEFSDGLSTATINIASGQAIQDIQRAVDDALLAPVGGANRIGLCLMGQDHTLFIESADPAHPLTLKVTVGGRTLGVIDPGQNEPGKTPEREEEPALGLRRTHEIRTFRYARDAVGNGDRHQVNDVGWVRLPAYVGSWPAAAPAPVVALSGTPAENLALPPGRFFMAARADAAKTRDYDATGEMIASAGTDPSDANRHFVHQSRYWMSFDNAETLGISTLVRSTGSGSVTDYLVDFLWEG